MNLDRILARVAEGMAYVDRHSMGHGIKYLPGVPSIFEKVVIDEVVDWWKITYPNDFQPSDSVEAGFVFNPGNRSEKCDFVFSSDGTVMPTREWAIEFKRLQFIGNNGKNNDHNVQKMLSPYLKDRSLIHDIHRLNQWQISQRQAVIGYMFSYDYDSCDDAYQYHPGEGDRIEAIRKVCQVNGAINGRLDPMVLIEIANRQFRYANLVYDVVVTEQGGLWRHPCGGKVIVFGWELLPHQRSDGSELNRQESEGGDRILD
jgi:hypothetical protein